MNKWQRHMHNSVVLRQLSGSGWTAAREKDTSASASSSLPHPLPWHLFQRRAWCRPGTAANRWTRRHWDQLMNKWMQHTAIICIFKEKNWHISALSAEKYRGVLLLNFLLSALLVCYLIKCLSLTMACHWRCWMLSIWSQWVLSQFFPLIRLSQFTS